MLPLHFLQQITPPAAKIYVALLCLARPTHGITIAPAPVKSLTDLTRLSPSTCIRALHELRDLKLILPYRPIRRQAAAYVLLPLPEAPAITPDPNADMSPLTSQPSADMSPATSRPSADISPVTSPAPDMSPLTSRTAPPTPTTPVSSSESPKAPSPTPSLTPPIPEMSGLTSQLAKPLPEVSLPPTPAADDPIVDILAIQQCLAAASPPVRDKIIAFAHQALQRPNATPEAHATAIATLAAAQALEALHSPDPLASLTESLP